MTMLDARERSERGAEIASQAVGRHGSTPATPVEASWRDFIFAEVWSRPGLDRRSRYLVSIASAASTNGPCDVIDDYVRGALSSGDLTQEELREAALHLAEIGRAHV